MADVITVKQEVHFQRIKTPNFILHKVASGARQDGIQEAPKTAIADLAPEAVHALASAWVDDFYRKAGLKPPRIFSPTDEGKA